MIVWLLVARNFYTRAVDYCTEDEFHNRMGLKWVAGMGDSRKSEFIDPVLKKRKNKSVSRQLGWCNSLPIHEITNVAR